MKKLTEQSNADRNKLEHTDAHGLDRRKFLTAGAIAASGVAVACVSPVDAANSGVASLEPVRPPDAPESGDLNVAAHRVETPGPRGVVTAGHPLAASAGLRMFMQGGAAGDAAVATVHPPGGGVADLVDLGRHDLVVLGRRAAVVVVAVRLPRTGGARAVAVAADG